MSVINKMLRDLDSRQASGAVAVLGKSSGMGAIEGTSSVAYGPLQTKAGFFTYRLKLIVLAVLFFVLAAVAWVMYGQALFESYVVPSTARPVTVPAPVAAPSVVVPSPVAEVQPNPASEATPPAAPAVSSIPDPAPGVAPAAATTSPAAEVKPAPALGASNASLNPTLPAPTLPKSDSVPSKPLPAIAAPALVTAANSAKTDVPLPATVPATPSVVPVQSANPVVPMPVRQPSVQETLASAQSLWTGGSREAAIELIREALSVAERAKAAGTLTADSPVLPSLVRELARMELAEGRPGVVMDLLIRLEPLIVNQADLWAVRGNAAQRLGRHLESSNAYLTALKLRPNEPRWMLGAAVSLAAQGQLSPAAEWAEKARAAGVVSPEISNYLKQLGVPLR